MECLPALAPVAECPSVAVPRFLVHPSTGGRFKRRPIFAAVDTLPEHVGAAEASRRRFLCLRVDAQEWACWALGLAFIFLRNPTLFLGGCTMSVPTDARGPLFSRCLARPYDLAGSHRGPLLPTEPSEGAVHAVFPLEGPPRSQPEEKSLSISKWKKVPFLIL